MYGKSTLTNKIIGKDITQIGDISKKNKMGKNTTTDVTLYEIEKDSYLLDTPGFQSMDIYEIPSKDLANFFLEFREHLKNCEFVSCLHLKEKNCGVLNALKNGKISNKRYENFVKIYNDLKYEEEHKW